jgi:hypothetical protein
MIQWVCACVYQNGSCVSASCFAFQARPSRQCRYLPVEIIPQLKMGLFTKASNPADDKSSKSDPKVDKRRSSSCSSSRHERQESFPFDELVGSELLSTPCNPPPTPEPERSRKANTGLYPRYHPHRM